MGYGCCVPHCDSHYKVKSGQKISYHEFPSNSEIRQKWLKNISRENWTPTNRETVCSIHFLPDDFTIGKKYRILKRTAIPSIFPNYPKYMQAAAAKLCIARKPPCERKLYEKLQAKANAIVTEVEDPQNDPECSNDQASTHLETVPELQNGGEEVVPCPINTPGRPKATPNEIKKRMRSLSQKAHYLKRTCKQLKQTNDLKNQTIKKLQAEIETWNLQPIHEDANAGRLKAIFLLDQLKGYKSKRPRWSEPVVRSCSIWRRKHPRGYSYCRENLIELPTKSTLQRFASSNEGEVKVVASKKSLDCDAQNSSNGLIK